MDLTNIKLDNLNINDIENLTKIGTNTTTNKQAPAKDFMETMKEVVDEVNAQQKTADKALSDVATGEIKDLHQAAIAIGKAETSMKVMLEVRNKAINAYKEILRTQV